MRIPDSISLIAFQASNQPSSLFIQEDKKKYSFKEIGDSVFKLSSFLESNYLKTFLISPTTKLKAKVTIKSPPRQPVVACCLKPSPSYLLTLLALHEVGAFVVPLNHHKPLERLLLEIVEVKADYLIMDNSLEFDRFNLQKKIKKIVPNFQTIINPETLFEVLKKKNSSHASHISNAPNSPSNTKKLIKMDWDKPAVCLFTSGSSHQPKPAVFSLRNFVHSAKSANAFFPFNKGDKWLHLMPFYHVSGYSLFFRALLGGGALVFTKRSNWLMKLVDYRISHLSLVASQINQLRNKFSAIKIKENFNPLKLILVGGGAMPDYLNKWLGKSSPLRPTYGLTESVAQLATFDPSIINSAKVPDFASNQLPLKILPKRKIKIVNGEIFIYQDSLFLGYLKSNKSLINPSNKKIQLTKPYKQGWFATGDLGVKKKNLLSIIGRKDHQFISGGENLQPEEIEKILLTYPPVTKALVFPIPHKQWGFQPAAALEINKKFVIEDLLIILKKKLEKYKIPVKFFFIKSNSLKLSRPVVLKMFKEKKL